MQVSAKPSPELLRMNAKYLYVFVVILPERR
jgi:hypothetical protein